MCLILNAVKRFLGSFDEWPAEILDILIIQHPSLRMLRKVFPFSYGNGARALWLRSFFMHVTCIRLRTITPSTKHEEMEKTPFGRHMSIYYKLRQKKYIYFHGRRRGYKKLVQNITKPITLGIYNTGFSFILGQAEGIRAANVF
jgi:hypothetical protein